MVDKAFSSIEKYLEFFKDIDDMHKSAADTFQYALDEINAAYGHLLVENDTTPESKEFLKPDIPKNKKETKTKRQSSRASRKPVATNQSTKFSENYVTAIETSDIAKDDETFRKSSRIASKKTVLAVHSVELEDITLTVSTGQTKSKEKKKKSKEYDFVASTKTFSSNEPPKLNENLVTVIETSDNEKVDDKFRKSSRIASKKTIPAVLSVELEEITPTVSTSQTKIEEKNEKSSKSSDLEESIMGAAHSTPISTPGKDDDNDDWKTPRERTPPSVENKEVSDFVIAEKKCNEEFEKLAGQGALLPSKLPLRSPTKKKNIQVERPCVENKNRFLRSNKVLQEINTNVETLQRKDTKTKKPIASKSNLGNKIKMGLQSQNAMKTNQHQNDNNINTETTKREPPLMKYFNQPKKKDTKALKSFGTKAFQKVIHPSQVVQQIESEVKAKKDHSEDVQYELDHVLENQSSEDEDSPKNPVPKWATKEMREYPLHVQAWIDKKETVYAWFYNEDIKKPKLEELFSETVEMRARTSSAMWSTNASFK